MALVATVVAAIGTALVWAEAAGWPFLRGPLARALSRTAGVPVVLGGDGAADARFHLSLFGRPRLALGSLRVGAAPGPAAPHLLGGRQIVLQWRWSDAWAWWRRGVPLSLTELAADTLDLRLLRDAGGRATWQIGAAPRSDPAAPSPAIADLPQVGRLTVRAGTIAIDDRPSDLRLQITLTGDEGDPAQPGSGQAWQARVLGQWRALPLDLQVTTGGVMPLVHQVDDSAAERDTDLDLRVQGRIGAAQIGFDGQAAALFGDRRLAGQLTLSGPSLDRAGEPLGLTLPRTPPFSLRGRLAQQGEVWALSGTLASIGRSRLGGDFKVDTRPARSLLTGRLTGSRLLLADLGPTVGAGTGNTPAVASSTKVLPRRPFDLPSLSRMDADVQVAINELDFGTDSLAPLRDVRARLHLQDGRLALEGLSSTVAGGRVEGRSSYDGTASPPRWTAQLKFSAVDLAGWVRATGTPAAVAVAPGATASASRLRQQRRVARQGGDQPVRHYLTGALDASFDVRGAGRSTGEILASMNGRIELQLREATVSHLVTELVGLDVAQALGVVLRGDRPLPLRCARLAATARQGVARIDRGVVDNADSTIWLGGQVDLGEETLALVAKARPKDWSPLSLRSPILLRGTLSEPQLGVDSGRLLGRLGAAALAGAALGPLATILPLVDLGQGGGPDPCAAPGATASPAPSASPASAAAAAKPTTRP